MGRLLIALLASVILWGPAGLEASRGRADTAGGHGALFEAASGRFSLARGVIAGSLAGMIDLAFAGTSSAICFLPGTFDVTVDGFSPGDLQPSSNCGYDASVRIDGFRDVRAAEDGARPMVVTWTDLAGRLYTLRFDGLARPGSRHVRVICLGASEAGCHTAVVDSTYRMLMADDGSMRDTGALAHLSVWTGADPADTHDLGIYDVPFTLTIEQLP
ncbi:MAG TPA: hypothetical protein VLA20_06010 [Vicinamibacterales bacterium]|nr:hypothetical protein [Vicinamibacterales bacterium]